MPENQEHELQQWLGELDTIRTEMQAAVSRNQPGTSFGIYVTRLEQLATKLRALQGAYAGSGTTPSVR